MKGTCKAKIYFVTDNKHKFIEASMVARDYDLCLEMLSGKKIEIQSNNLIDIAVYSALENYKEVRRPLLVEDAGLFIEALHGFPGPYSSYVYKTIGIEGILKLLRGIDNRRAYFASAVVLIYEPYIIKCEERVYGYISREPRGEKGFGFDPIFVPEGETRTFAEMDVAEKNKYSHRARALSKAFSELMSMLKT